MDMLKFMPISWPRCAFVLTAALNLSIIFPPCGECQEPVSDQATEVSQGANPPPFEEAVVPVDNRETPPASGAPSEQPSAPQDAPPAEQPPAQQSQPAGAAQETEAGVSVDSVTDVPDKDSAAAESAEDSAVATPQPAQSTREEGEKPTAPTQSEDKVDGTETKETGAKENEANERQEEFLQKIDPKIAQNNYEKAREKWRASLVKIRQYQYHVANTRGRQRQVEALAFSDYMAGVAKPDTEALLKAAQQYYVSAPNANDEVAQFLITVVKDALINQRPENPWRIAQLLTENNVQDTAIPGMGGVLAFEAEQFKAAKSMLERAKSEGGMKVEIIDKFLQECDYRMRDAEKGDLPHVVMTTDQGEVEFELFEDDAPNTVANFITLAQSKFYDGNAFHRIEPSLVQGGCPIGDGSGSPGYNIRFEGDKPTARKHFIGSIAMARLGGDLNSAGSQFYICRAPMENLDGQYTVFGRVVRGWPIIANIRGVSIEGENSPIIRSIRVIKDRGHPYSVEQLPLSPSQRTVPQ